MAATTMNGDRTSGTQASLERLIVQLAAAINTRALYAPHHPRCRQSYSLVIEALTAVCEERRQDSITFLLVEDELVFDQRPLRKGGLYQQPLIRALKRRGVERLTLARGLELTECQEFVEALAIGGVPRSTRHVIVGQIEIAAADPDKAARPDGLGAEGSERTGRGRGEGLTGEQIDSVRGAFVRFRAERRPTLVKLEDMVWGFMDALARSTGGILPVAPLRGHDEYTFIHSVNVSLLVLAQARSFGIQGQTLHSVGLAALLHDIGKMTIPLEVLNKPGRLDENEWKIMMTHAEVGAWHLCALEAAAPLSILVAFEHHLRFDGQSNYPVLKATRRPNLASQLAAIADTYDAICTTRPYKKALSQQFARDVLRSRVGTFHDPFLVGNFFQLLGAD